MLDVTVNVGPECFPKIRGFSFTASLPLLTTSNDLTFIPLDVAVQVISVIASNETFSTYREPSFDVQPDRAASTVATFVEQWPKIHTKSSIVKTHKYVFVLLADITESKQITFNNFKHSM